MSSGFAKREAAKAWGKEKTKNKTMDVELCEAFAEIIEELTSQAWLGNATTRQLLAELTTRIEIGSGCEFQFQVGKSPLDYKTVSRD